MVAVWLKPSCRWLAPSSGWPLETVGAWREEGEREARWEERERERCAMDRAPVHTAWKVSHDKRDSPSRRPWHLEHLECSRQPHIQGR